MTRQIGILVTNTDESEFAQRHPKDGEKFTRLIQAARPEWRVKVYSVKDGQFPATPHACDGYVITGSPASVNGAAPWIAALMEFIRRLEAAKVPTVGCCFGHQAIAKALGGTVARNAGGWGFGVSPTRFLRHESWMQPDRPELNLYSAHSEQVTALPEGAEVLGGDAFCPVSSFRVGNTFFTTEYHPEMTCDFFVALTKEIEGYVGQDVAARARQQAKTPADGAIFGEWMAKFLEMPRPSRSASRAGQ